jgi:hypothetical protein
MMIVVMLNVFMLSVVAPFWLSSYVVSQPTAVAPQSGAKDQFYALFTT